VKWIAVSICVVVVGLAGLYGLRNSVRSNFGPGSAPRVAMAVDADASEFCRDTSRDALALVLVTDRDPYHIARAYGSKHAFGDMARYVTQYWGCLDGLGIAATPPAKFLSPTW
jgi:hypothetical protein